MSEGMKFLLNRHSFEVQPDMMVTKCIIKAAGVVSECNRCVNKHGNNLRMASEHLKKISRIDTQDCDLMKLVVALKMICCPEEKFAAGQWRFSGQQLKRLRDDAPKYKDKILKMPCLVIYDEMYWDREVRTKAARVLVRLIKQAKKAYEAKQAREAASNREIGHDGEDY